MKYSYLTQGTCSKQIFLDIDEQGVIRDVQFVGGCNGNLQGISKLVIGMHGDEVVKKLKGIQCGTKPTSCPDQLCKAIEAIKKSE